MVYLLWKQWLSSWLCRNTWEKHQPYQQLHINTGLQAIALRLHAIKQ